MKRKRKPKAKIWTPRKNRYDMEIKREEINNGGPACHYIYIIQCKSHIPYAKCSHFDNYKIGIAGDVVKRLRNMQIDNPFPLHLVFWSRLNSDNKTRLLEKEIHKLLKPIRIRGEWFQFPYPNRKYGLLVSIKKYISLSAGVIEVSEFIKGEMYGIIKRGDQFFIRNSTTSSGTLRCYHKNQLKNKIHSLMI